MRANILQPAPVPHSCAPPSAKAVTTATMIHTQGTRRQHQIIKVSVDQSITGHHAASTFAPTMETTVAGVMTVM